MSFSSAEWTIPELCVWIVTRSAEALNSLPQRARDSLTLADLRHTGAYAARDQVISEAQKGFSITYLRLRDPFGEPAGRVTLQSDFFANAEILDTRSSMSGPGPGSCVARRRDDPNAVMYYGLQVESSKARGLWPPHGNGSMPTASADRTQAAEASNQAKFDEEKRRRIAESGDHDYDAMTLWARHNLEDVDSKAADELWQHRSPEFSRDPGRRKATAK